MVAIPIQTAAMLPRKSLSPRSTEDLISGMIDAMKSAGIIPKTSISSQLLQSNARPTRFQCEGDKPGRKNGWAICRFRPMAFASFGNWRLGVSGSWTERGGFNQLSAAEREAIDREIAAISIKQDQKRALASAIAKEQWRNSDPAQETHPYLERKNIPAEKLHQHAADLIVPIYSVDAELKSLQFISGDGAKRFLPGGQIQGNFWLCGKPSNLICIGEGMATMAAVRRATGHPVVAAMNAGNLLPVAAKIRERRPAMEIIFCADDDEVGISKATFAAKSVGGKLIVPRAGGAH